jgi:hypothetical protein
MTAESATAAAKKTVPNLTPGSHVRVRSAGDRDSALVTTGTFRGLVSVAGDNSMAIELDEGADRGKVRLIPISAVFAIDILEAAKAEEERRSEPAQSPGYFR